jgi:hypothetical protein
MYLETRVKSCVSHLTGISWPGEVSRLDIPLPAGANAKSKKNAVGGGTQQRNGIIIRRRL